MRYEKISTVDYLGKTMFLFLQFQAAAITFMDRDSKLLGLEKIICTMK
jgi:hypothetical protein